MQNFCFHSGALASVIHALSKGEPKPDSGSARYFPSAPPQKQAGTVTVTFQHRTCDSCMDATRQGHWCRCMSDVPALRIFKVLVGRLVNEWPHMGFTVHVHCVGQRYWTVFGLLGLTSLVRFCSCVWRRRPVQYKRSKDNNQTVG